MSSVSAQLALLITHSNEFLFSNHYLGRRLPTRREWKEIEADLVFDELRARWAELDPNGLNEAQTEDWWIKPVLKVLGHHYSVQVSIDTPRNVRQPDYVLARTEEASRELRGVLGEAELTDALAVADAKKWGRNLDVRGTDDSKISDVPSLQIDFYLRYSGIKWGVLTNGKQWRLYHRKTSHKLEVFYEVDLPALLEQNDKEAFKYFYLFFRREAFIGSSSFLDLVLEESKAYEHGVSEDLQTQVYDALMSVSRGFFELGSNELKPDVKTLKTVHDNSLIVLYRLLFLLFAESRGLLPMDNRVYREDYSLEQIKKAVQRSGGGTVGIAGGTKWWQALSDLWRFVDKGEEALEVPPYNGGLFNPEKHPFLEKHRVGDRHLAEAIDLLARAVDEETGEREFVDYRDLEVRHLGSIYEGLLEYKLVHAVEALKIDKGTYVPAETDDVVDVPAGQVYLITDKGDRKTTGSYYTPDYIVQYIVERTVGPILDELREEHTNGEGALEERETLVEKVLRVNVLDPAMGSGHFLVDVIDFIGRFLVEASPDKEGDDAETELAYWRRRVAQACVYGVDLNPLAVELAKLSLWLRTVAKDKPLSFLDHHLRCGNSLVGLDVDDLPSEQERKNLQKRRKAKKTRDRNKGQVSWLGSTTFQQSMSSARSLMDQIEAIAGDKLEQVQEAADLYEELVEEHTKAPRLVADMVLAQRFGLDINKKFFKEMLPRLRDGSWKSVPKYRNTVGEAEVIAGELGFFHWELEFPEVFFAEEGELAGEQAGFDVVVGNPPYVRMERFKKLKDYLRNEYEVYDTRADLFAYFIERSLDLCRVRGEYGVIISNKWLRAKYGKKVRQYLLERARLQELVDFKDLPVFGAVTYPLILIALKEEGLVEGSFTAVNIPHLPTSSLSALVEEHSTTVPQKNLSASVWSLEDPLEQLLVERLMKDFPTLKEIVAADVCMGVKSGLNEAFIIDRNTRDLLIARDPSSQEIIKQVLVGRETGRYQLSSESQYLIYTKHDVVIADYPAVHQYLEQFKTRLEQRATNQKWFELQQPQEAYESFFEGKKILFPDIAEGAEFYRDSDGYFMTTTVNFVPSDDWFLLGLLNSRVSNFFLLATAATYRGGYIRLKRQYVEALPVPRVPALKSEAAVKRQEVAGAAERMQILFSQRQKLQRALNPFKYLNRGAEVAKLPDVFRSEIKFSDQVFDLGTVHHDVDGLALEYYQGAWLLKALLKKRDPESDWADWIKDGNEIVREWVAVYRFENMDERKSVYYQKAFEVLSEFDRVGAFPGGKTRTTKKKMELINIPSFDQEVELDALLELTKELIAIEVQIKKTDDLINRLVYQLYSLTDEEIAVVEEGG